MRDHFNLGGVDVFIKDRLSENIDLSFVFEYIGSRIPFFFMDGIDIIYIGQFPKMKERDINAYFEDGAIYVTNLQDDEMDMIEDLIHEISHAVENNHQEFIYGRGALQREFVENEYDCLNFCRKNMPYLLTSILISIMTEPSMSFFIVMSDMMFSIKFAPTFFLLDMLLLR